jgi:gliding motility-associated-like protein
MKNQPLRNLLCSVVVCVHLCGGATAQTSIAADTNAQRLCQRLLGGGLSISNFHFTGAAGSAGFFKASSTSALGIDSGIVLSTGFVKTNFYPGRNGIDHSSDDGASGIHRASNNLDAPGDSDLAHIIPDNFDAAALEFDFVPTGDSIAFRYVFASEEYPLFNCTQYNDVFAFYISGPGFSSTKNIALVPNTNIPVAINSINSGMVEPMLGIGGDKQICGSMGPGSPFTQYYVDNRGNQQICFNGFTQVLTATAGVIPCQTYHLKIVIADGVDRLFDSGVFLQAKSLRSSGLQIINTNPLSNTGKPYLIEGCTQGGIRIVRNEPSPYPQQVQLTYGGTAVNGVDVMRLPSSIIIPANDSSVFLPIVPIADQLMENKERLKVYISNACSANLNQFMDSIEVEIRDVQQLSIVPGSPVTVCPGAAVQLTASAGFAQYHWSGAAILSDTSSASPWVSLSSDSATVYCSATVNSCLAEGMVKVYAKKLKVASVKPVQCNTSATGHIKLTAGWQWKRPLQFWLDNQAPQTDSTFSNLPPGTYVAKVKDATGCVDSLTVSVTRFTSTLHIDNTLIIKASCMDSTSGTVSLLVSGGATPYRFSLDGAGYTTSSSLKASLGQHFTTVKDANGCTDTAAFRMDYNNTISLSAGRDTFVCQGSSVQLQVQANTNNLSWSPALPASALPTINPEVSPMVSTTYIVTAHRGFCEKTDSVEVKVQPLPIAQAGNDTSICSGSAIRLNGSGGVTYNWSPATYLNSATVKSPICRPEESTVYTLTVTDQYHCTSARASKLKVMIIPPVLADAGRDTAVAKGQPLRLVGKQLNDTTAKQYIWSPNVGLNNPVVASPVAVLLKDQTYRLTLRTPQGCQGEAMVTVKVFEGPDIYVPTGFTPNGDGRNDVLRPTPAGLKAFTHFSVFNRWGQLIFRTTTCENGWDGKVDGQPQFNQSFVWMAEGIGYNGETVQRKGSVLVVP